MRTLSRIIDKHIGRGYHASRPETRPERPLKRVLVLETLSVWLAQRLSRAMLAAVAHALRYGAARRRRA
jgi:hypothetical protein